LLTFLLATTPLGAQTIVFDPHLDLPTSASATGWTERGDPNAQFDLERATTGGLTIALFVPQEARDAASLAAAQQAFTVRDSAIHAIADANPKLAGCARSPADVRRIVASGRIAIVESLLNA
jgi:microsomal dipeptidase-like Zn-dependent dipeptidase